MTIQTTALGVVMILIDRTTMRALQDLSVLGAMHTLTNMSVSINPSLAQDIWTFVQHNPPDFKTPGIVVAITLETGEVLIRHANLDDEAIIRMSPGRMN